MMGGGGPLKVIISKFVFCIIELLMEDLWTSDENYTTNYKILHRIVNNEYLNEYLESQYLQYFFGNHES